MGLRDGKDSSLNSTSHFSSQANEKRSFIAAAKKAAFRRSMAAIGLYDWTRPLDWLLFFAGTRDQVVDLIPHVRRGSDAPSPGWIIAQLAEDKKPRLFAYLGLRVPNEKGFSRLP